MRREVIKLIVFMKVSSCFVDSGKKKGDKKRGEQFTHVMRTRCERLVVWMYPRRPNKDITSNR